MGTKRKVKIVFGVLILPYLPRLVLTGQNVQKLLKKPETEKFAFYVIGYDSIEIQTR